MLASVHQAKEAHISLNPCLRHPSSLLREPVWAVDSFWFDRMDKIFPESTHRFMTVHARIFFTFGEGGEGVWTFPGKFKFSKNYRKYASELPTHTHHLGKMFWIRACLSMRKHILHFLLNFTINHLFFTIQFSFFQL